MHRRSCLPFILIRSKHSIQAFDVDDRDSVGIVVGMMNVTNLAKA